MKKLILILCLGLCPFLFSEPRSFLDKESKDKVDRPERKPFPRHWGPPPRIQTRDMVALPGGFGKGSSTLAHWIKNNLKKDAEKEREKPTKPVEGQKPKPIPPIQPVPRPPKEIKEKIELHKKIQDSLRAALKRKIDALEKGVTKEEVRKVVEAFRKENAERIEDATHIGKQIQEWHKDNKPERPKRPEPSPQVKAKLAEVKLLKNSLDLARKSLSQELKGKSKEEKSALLEAFKESQKEKHQELKTAQKALAEEVRNRIQTKARRE